MPEYINLLLPDDAHYYFGVELAHSPAEVKERLLRKPEYLYSIDYSADEEDTEDESNRSWLYLWRCNEGWDSDVGRLSSAELWKMECALRHMKLHVVLHALTEGEALNPASQSEREAHRYILVKPRKSGGNKTVPQLNLGRAASNRDCVELHVIAAAELPSLYEGCLLESHVPGDVPQEVIDTHCQMYIRRALTVMKSIHDADSLELLLPLREEYERLSSHLLKYADESVEVFHRVLAEVGQMEYQLMLQPWYVGSHHQRVTHPSGLVICDFISSGNFGREVLDLSPGRRLCYKRTEVGGKIIPAGEGDEAMPQRDSGRFHIMPDDSVCGRHVDEHGRIIRWVHR